MRKIVFVNDEKQTEYKDIPANVFDAVEHLMDTYGDIYSDINREKIDCEHTDCNNCVNHKYCDYEPNCSEIPTGSTTKNDLGVDCVSRQAVDSLVREYLRRTTDETIAFYEYFLDLPSVTPQEPKTGHWIWCVGSHKCSNCEEYTCFSDKELLRYCPNCGAKMVEPQESEEV
jgi:hypothetical protein